MNTWDWAHISGWTTWWKLQETKGRLIRTVAPLFKTFISFCWCAQRLWLFSLIFLHIWQKTHYYVMLLQERIIDGSAPPWTNTLPSFQHSKFYWTPHILVLWQEIQTRDSVSPPCVMEIEHTLYNKYYYNNKEFIRDVLYLWFITVWISVSKVSNIIVRASKRALNEKIKNLFKKEISAKLWD